LLDIELAFPIALILLEAAGLAYAALATYLYFRFERSAADMHVPVALSAVAMHYVLAFVLAFGSLGGEVLLPLVLLFLMAVTPALAIWLGSQARSKAGIRIVVAGAFTLAAFVCGVGHDIYRSTKFGW
jgi:hypothetical protein